MTKSMCATVVPPYHLGRVESASRVTAPSDTAQIKRSSCMTMLLSEQACRFRASKKPSASGDTEGGFSNELVNQRADSKNRPRALSVDHAKSVRVLPAHGS